MHELRELANDCGVSVQSVRKWCERNGVSKNASGRYEITAQTRILILEYYKVKQKGRRVSKKLSDKVSPSLSALLQQLEAKDAQLAAKDEQLAAKDAQIAAKDEQIDKLTDTISSLAEQNANLVDVNKALSAANALHTAADKKEALLVAESECEDSQRPKKKPSRWQRLLAAWHG